MHVQGLGVPDVVGTPDPVDQLPARHHPAGIAQQHLEQLEFLQRKAYRLTVDRDRVPFHIHPDTAALHHIGDQLDILTAAQHRPDPGHQFTVREGFGDIVVGAQFQAEDAVGVVAARGQHQDRNPARCAAGRADLAQGLDAVRTRHHHVEDRDGIVAAQRFAHAVVAVVDAGGAKAFLSQVFGKHPDEFDVVVNQQYVVHGQQDSKRAAGSFLCGGKFYLDLHAGHLLV